MLKKMFFFVSENLKDLLLLSWLSMEAIRYYERFLSIDGGLARVGYVFVLIFLLFCLGLAAYVKSGLIRLAFASLFFVSSLSYLVYERVTAEFLTYDAFVNMINSFGFLLEVIGQHFYIIISFVPFSLVLFFAFFLPPRRRISFSNYIFVFSPFFGVLFLASIMFLRGGDGGRGLPTFASPLSYMLLAGYELINLDAESKNDVSISRVSPPLINNIVLIIDESISGRYLDINDSLGVETPLSFKNKKLNIHNFGLATSITNCSAGTNVTLRYGGTRDNYQYINSNMPSIWEYARKAGFHTVYIDSQRTEGALQNFMDDRELRYINDFVQFDGSKVIDRDILAAKKIVSYLNDDAPKFILVNKVGAHFPVNDKYPNEFIKYEPILPRGFLANVSDTGDRSGFGGLSNDWVAYRNSYRNTLLWNVGAFFKELFGNSRFENTIIIYTSDHGQDLHEKGRGGHSTHCSSSPTPEEGIVPLVVIESKKNISIDWASFSQDGFNRSSHYQIFPTLLNLMGYEKDSIRKIYGASMFDESIDPFTFNSLFNARLGRSPIWNHVDIESVSRPPQSDFLVSG